MDSLSHLVAGALTPMAVKGAPRRRMLIVYSILAGELPDADVFFGMGSAEVFLNIHRGVTHAILYQPIMACILALPFYTYFRSTRHKGMMSFGGLFCLALFALYVHLFLDSMTTFGTKVFLPFSPVRVWFPSMFIIDLFFLLPLLFLWWQGLRVPAMSCQRQDWMCYSPKARKFALVAFAWLFFYPLACLGVNYGFATYLSNNIGPALYSGEVSGLVQDDNSMLPGHNKRVPVELLTEPLSPLVWKVIVDEGEKYAMGTAWLWQSPDSVTFNRYNKYDPQKYQSFVAQASLFQYFADFCHHMVQSIESAEGGNGQRLDSYVYSDLRYIISPQSPAHWFGRDTTNFVLEAKSSEDILFAYRFLFNESDTGTPWEFVEH